MLQQRSITQVVITLAEDVLELLEQLIELLLLERERHSGSGGWQGLVGCLEGGRSGAGCFCEVDHLEDAYALPCVKLKGLWPVIVHGISEL